MNYELANWVISLVALILALISIYFQYFKKGKLICKLHRHIEPAIDVNLDKELCKIGITVIFENNQKKDWIITSLSVEYRLFDGFGIHSDLWQLIRKNHSLRIPAGQSLDKNFEIILPLKNLEFWINPLPPPKSKAKSNSKFSYPFTQILPFWEAFYENKDSIKNLLRFIKEKCPKEDMVMCLETVNYEIRNKSDDR